MKHPTLKPRNQFFGTAPMGQVIRRVLLRSVIYSLVIVVGIKVGLALVQTIIGANFYLKLH